MEEININEMVVIEQLPKIYEQLDEVNKIVLQKTENIDETLKEISKLSEEEQEIKKQEVKKYRTYLNSLKNSLEDKRKEIKKAISQPYDEFEKVYKEKTLEILNNGINKLGDSIATIEGKQLEKKKNLLVEFFNQYVEYYHIEKIITFEDLPIKINLSSSNESLKKEIIAFCEKISEDLVAISSEEFKDEILLEYQNNGFEYTKARINIIEKHKKLEELKQEQEKIVNQVEKEKEVIENVESIIEPIEIDIPVAEEQEQHQNDLEISFTIKTTKEIYQKLLKDKLQEFKHFLQVNNIEYE